MAICGIGHEAAPLKAAAFGDARGGGSLQGPAAPNVEQRIRLSGAASWTRYPAPIAEDLRAGRVRSGLDELALYIAYGEPEFSWSTTYAGKRCRALLYATTRQSDVADTVVYACDGVLEQIQPLRPVIGCDALAVLADRIEGEREFFSALPLERQWDVFRGHLAYGRPKAEVELTWGSPAKTFDREVSPGRELEVWFYPDGSGQTGGLEALFREDRLVAWNVLPVQPPPEPLPPPPPGPPPDEPPRPTPDAVVNAWMPFIVAGAGAAAGQVNAQQTNNVTQVNGVQDNSRHYNINNSTHNTNIQSNNTSTTTVINNAPAPAPACVASGAGGCSPSGAQCCDRFAICERSEGNRCVKNLLAPCQADAECLRGLRCLPSPSGRVCSNAKR